jgi:hypothetical protein
MGSKFMEEFQTADKDFAWLGNYKKHVNKEV